MEILSIALPAALALAADPITSLVSTGFVGHLGISFCCLIFSGVVLFLQFNIGTWKDFKL